MAEEDPTATGQKILHIEPRAIHRISSGQGILDLAGAVKELVENSLDSGASRIDIRLTEYGADLIEVADNGPGVSPEYYQALTKKYYTSKIFRFEDLQHLSSFGFRGEALNSLCHMSRVTIITRTADDQVATRLEYDLSGIIATRKCEARYVGTTVSVANLFFPFPVRLNEFRRNLKREYGKLVTMLQAYALISKRVRLLCTNRAGKAGRTIVIQTEGSLSIRSNVVSVFGTKTVKCVEWINILVKNECRVEGFLSRPSAGCGRSSRDRQFFFINGRPVDMPRAAKVLNELYRSFNLRQSPIAIINFTLPTTAYDINVAPDKRKVFVHGEGDLLKGFIAALQTECAPFVRTESQKKVAGPTCGEAVPPAVWSNEDGEFPETDRGNSCGDTGQDGNVEREGVPTSATSGSDCRNRQFNVPDDGISLKLKPFRPNVTLKSFRRNSCNAILSTASPSAGLLRTTTTETQRHSTFPAKLTGLVSGSKRAPENSEECNDILSTATLSAGSSSIFPSETQLTSSVQSRPSGLVSRLKRSLEESEDWPRLRKCGLTNTAAVDEKASKVQQVLQPDNVRQGSSSKWFTRSSETNGRDVHRRTVYSRFGLRARDTKGPIGNAQGRLVKSRYFSSAYQDELPSESPSLLRTEQVTRGPDTEGPKGNAQGRIVKSRFFSSAYQDELPSESPSLLRTEPVTHGPAESITSDEGAISDLNHFGFENQHRKPLVSEGLNLESSVLPFNRVVAPEASETVHRPKAASVLVFDMERLKMLHERGFYERWKQRMKQSSIKRPFTVATVGDNSVGKTAAEKMAILEAATKELEQNFNKADFKLMKVVGQFDKHFILATLNQDLFIVDQHTADEVYKFEHLMRTSVLKSQILPRPVTLELDAVDEKIVKRHKEIFRKNGFDFLKIRTAPIGCKLQLSAVPACTDGMLGVEDVKELISLLASRRSEGCKCDAGHLLYKCSCQSSFGLPRPSRVKAMLASESCKLSVKVGYALGMEEMKEVVSHLAELEAPWTCPHGRPTIRHIVDLSLGLKLTAHHTAHGVLIA